MPLLFCTDTLTDCAPGLLRWSPKKKSLSASIYSNANSSKCVANSRSFVLNPHRAEHNFRSISSFAGTSFFLQTSLSIRRDQNVLWDSLKLRDILA